MNSTFRATTTLIALVLILGLVSTGYTQEPTRAPLRPQVERESLPGRGFIPPRVDLSHLTGKPAAGFVQASALPTRFDWRETGKVTSVKSQGSCGACYSFASLANFESKLLIQNQPTFNFSENNAKECNWYEITGTSGGTSCAGGNYHIMANLFSKLGTVLDADDPYVAADVACDGGNPYIKTLLDWRIISEGSVPSAAVLKQYIYDNGPVYTTLYAGDGSAPAWSAEYNAYNGSYTLYYTGSYEPNHAVLIVGWDDDLVHAGGTGGWIVKNSWGTSWGGTCDYGTEKGYFYIAYGSASIGMWSSYIYDWQDFDSDGELLYYDEGGYSANWGYSPSTTAWGMCKFIQPATAYVTRVEFWTNDITTDIDVYVYDNFNGTTLTGLLTSQLNLSFTEAGYHSVALDTPPEISTGNDFYVAVKFTNDNYPWPISADELGPNETATTYMSSNGSGWLDMGTFDSDDIGIRARTSVDLPVDVVDTDQPVVHSYRLANNYPNPFNPSTTIVFSLERHSQVELSIYNLLGQKVNTLLNEVVTAGEHSVTWDGRDFDGDPVASGVYLYQLKTDDFVDSKKMLLLR